MQAKDVITLVGVVVAGSGFLFGLIQYHRAQKWKAAEFVAGEIKEAFSDPLVRLALHLMDWNSSVHDLTEQTGNKALASVRIGDIALAAAMVPHWERPGGYNVVEVRIRLAFDELLGRLQRFEHFIETELVKPDDFKPYLAYWLDLLGTPSPYGKSLPVLHAIWRYIDAYRYHDVQRFFGRYGYDITRFDAYPTYLTGITAPPIQVEESQAIDSVVHVERMTNAPSQPGEPELRSFAERVSSGDVAN